ncbi:tyrosine-type recombinase/integrase [Pseudactinotalea terrae]|uniref:tyrosine-type recombinase/integrase n=1 Tax=Pseudactinotalea terrae TaxID=1743262 RepID=UPI0019D67719|nr:tyrosine-type recombinase/integrase [Pseudactinotalea terrae]
MSTTTTAYLPPAWSALVDPWERAELRAGRAASTLRKRRKHLSWIAADLADPLTATTADLAAWFRGQNWRPTTATAVRSSVRTFYAWAAARGLVDTDPALYLSKLRTDEARPLGSRGPLPVPVPTTWEHPLRLYARHLRALGRSEMTVGLRVRHLAAFARYLEAAEPFAATFYDLVEYLAGMEVAAETRRSVRATLRSFYGWALEDGHITTDPARRLPIPRRSLSQPHPASEEAIRYALAAADPRERLMLRLAAEVGLRRAEVAQVHTRDLLEDAGGWSLVVKGKGARVRVVPLPAGLAAELRALPQGWAFPSIQSDGHLSPHAVGSLVARLLPQGVSMHALRHRFATRAYEIDRDVFTVQQLLGHSSPETTRRYVAIDADHLRSTVDTLDARSSLRR